MNPWFETIGVIQIALLGIILGKVFSGLRKPYWTLGYFLPSLLITMLVLARYNNALPFVPPFSWITAGRVRFIILALAVTMGLTTPLSRLPRKCEKLIIGVLMVVVVAWFSVYLLSDHRLYLRPCRCGNRSWKIRPVRQRGRNSCTFSLKPCHRYASSLSLHSAAESLRCRRPEMPIPLL